MDKSNKVRNWLQSVRRNGVGFLVCLVLLAPSVAYLAGGSSSLQTNSGIDKPNFRLNFSYPGEFSKWLAESVALKNEAIRWDGRIDRKVFGETASAGAVSARVLKGEDRVSFIVDALSEACNPHIATDGLVVQLEKLSELITMSGREFRFVVSPDKSTILRDLLPSDYSLKDCFETYNDELWQALADSEIRGFVNLRDALNSARISRREILFKRRDTHWDDAGAAIASREIVDSIEPGLWEDNLLTFTGQTEYGGDLNALSGENVIDLAPTYSHLREGVTQSSVEVIDQAEHGRNRHILNSSESSMLIPGRTLVFGDSFSEAAESFYMSYFADVTYMRLDNFSTETYLSLIKNADRVIFWTVERSLSYRVAYDWGTEDFLRALSSLLT